MSGSERRANIQFLCTDHAVLSILIRGEQKFRARKVRQARNNTKSTMPFSRPTDNRSPFLTRMSKSSLSMISILVPWVHQRKKLYLHLQMESPLVNYWGPCQSYKFRSKSLHIFTARSTFHCCPVRSFTVVWDARNFEKGMSTRLISDHIT